jgi:hypothetical protein
MILRRIALVCGLAACLGAHDQAIAQSLRAPVPRSHRHPGVAKPAVEHSIPELSVTETTLEATTARENTVTDRRRRYDAFTALDTRLFVAERRSGKVREIRGLPFEWRPFSNLTWADDRTLMFDRWSSPHVGMHYAVDVVSGRLVAAQSFHDR